MNSVCFLHQELAPIYPIVTFQPTEDYGEHPIIPKEIRKRIKKTMKIPMMFGLCENEAVLGFTGKLKSNFKHLKYRKL